MNKLALWTSVALISMSTAAYAGPEDVRSPEPKNKVHHTHGGHYDDAVKDMTPEQRKAYFEERKAKWDAMSDAEKVKVIEEKRAERLKQMDDEWKHMSNAEKIDHVEKRFMHKGKKGCDKWGKGHKKPE